MRIVQAEEILQKIEMAQPVQYDNVIVAGDLNIGDLKLPKVKIKSAFYVGRGEQDLKLVASPITIANSIIHGPVNFKLTNFREILNFPNTRFENAVISTGALFNQTADFSDSYFNQSASFKASQFKQSISFRSSHFNQFGDFSGSCFSQSANFADTRFNQSTNFVNTEFNQSANFRYSQFNQSVNFQSSRFRQSANFGVSKFNQPVDFSCSEFNKSADFSNSQFHQESFFSNVRFNNVDFNSATFAKDAFFEDATIKGILNLTGTNFGKLKIRWSSIRDMAFDDTAYYFLIENFKKVGLIDDANKCYYTYRAKHGLMLLDQKDFAYWFFDFMAWLTYGYGLKPWQPLGWSILFILLAALFFWRSESVQIKGENTRKLSFWNSLLLGATYYTSGASNIISATPEEFAPRGAAKYVIVLLRLLGWIFFVLFLSSLGRIV